MATVLTTVLATIANNGYAVDMRPLGPVAMSVAAALALAGCGESASSASSRDTAAREVLEVVVGLYPYEFVAHHVGGDDAEVRNLTSPGAEPHDLELTAQQVGTIRSADLVLYSRGFQPAVDAAVDGSGSGSDAAVDVLSLVEVRTPDEDEHGDDEDGDDEHGEDGHDHAGEDPHVWLDPTRLATIADAVAERMAALAPDAAPRFAERAQALRAELEQLDGDLSTGLSSCARTDVVTSHDAFGYLTERYGLRQLAVSGLSPEDEPSPRRLAEVATTARERGVTTIFFEELVSPRVAEQVAREVGAETAVLSPLEGPPEDGDYLTAMRANLDALRKALDCA